MSARNAADPAHYAVEELLRDGGSIHVRAIRPDDRDRLRRHFEGLSEDSIYHRFFGHKRALSEAELTRLTDLDFSDHVGLVATLGRGDEERFIGVARYIRTVTPNRAELAFAVLDEYQGRGIATVLLDHLSRIARVGGISEFESDVLGDNKPMLEVFARSGFRLARSAQAGIVHLTFPTAETDELAAAMRLRERNAAARSLAWIVQPRSIAVIGASRDPFKIGGAILQNLKRYGFAGPIYPVNPVADEIQGLRCYRSLNEIGEPVDLAVIVVPAELVEEQIAECARAQVHGVVVITSGFAEVSAEGREREARIFELVRRSGMRMVGPNCMGVINTHPTVRLDATFAPFQPLSGNIGMFSQSGALGIAILDHARKRNLGLSTFISAGNRADVSNNDLLAYWADDPATALIVLYLESVGNPRKFARLAREVAREKPIVAVKSGRSAAGMRAASSHSASLANLDVAVEALFEQAGVIRTDTLEGLFDVAALLSTQPIIPAGGRVAVVTNAGGPAILLADACEARGLKLPALEESTLQSLRASLPARSSFSNPIDMTASASPADFERAIAAVGRDRNVDAAIAVYVPPMVTRPEEAAAGIARGAGNLPAEKPLLVVFVSTAGAPEELNRGPRGTLPAYSFPENAAIALAAAHRYAQWRARPLGTVPLPTRGEADAVRAIVDCAIAGAKAPLWLAPDDVALLLSAAGIRVAESTRVTADDAAAAAATIGYPLVAKAIAPGVAHKSDAGGVILDLESAGAVAAAVTELRARMAAIGANLEGVLLQRQIRGGIEMMAGVSSDPTFGPLLVCGLGGTTAELLKDVSFRLHPLTDVDAAEMIAALRSSRLLDGYRGRPAGDRAALIALLMRLSVLIELVPELSVLDLDPIKVLPPGQGAVVVDARIRLRP